MEVKHIPLSDLHFEHRLWNNELKFFAEEIAIYEHRLEELVKKYTTNEVLVDLEMYQNKFIRQKEVMDELRHDIHLHEQQLARYAEEHPIAVDHVKFEDHASLRNRMEQFRKIYAELKHFFMNFLVRWM